MSLSESLKKIAAGAAEKGKDLAEQGKKAMDSAVDKGKGLAEQGKQQQGVAGELPVYGVTGYDMDGYRYFYSDKKAYLCIAVERNRDCHASFQAPLESEHGDRVSSLKINK